MEQAKRVAKNTGFLYGRMAITVFISLYSTRLVLAALGVTDFGIFNVVAGAIAMLTFLNAAMASATQRFMSYAEGKGDFQSQVGIFNISVLLHLIVGFAVVILLEVTAYFLFDGILEIPVSRLYAAKVIFQCMVLSTFFKIISVPYDAVINAHENMLLVAILGVIEAFLKLGIALYVTITKFDTLISYGFLMAIMAILLLIIRRIYCHNKYAEVKINIRKHYDPFLFKEMSNFAAWSFLGSSSSMLAYYGQGIVLNIFFGPSVNAAQGIATQINGQLGAFSTTMLSALNPAIAKNEGAGNRGSMLKMTLMGSKISFFLLAFMCIPVLVEMPFILNLWLKNVPEYAVIFCRLLLIQTLIEQIFIPLNTSIRAVGKIRGLNITGSILAIFPLLISYILFNLGYAPYFLYVIFIIYAVSKALSVIHYGRKHCNLKLAQFAINVLGRCIITFILVLVISFLPLIFLKSSIFRLIIVLICSVIIFPILVYTIGFNKEERVWFIQLTNSFLTRFKLK